MQFYPHNINVTTIGFAVSASIANSGSFINNFAAIPINTIATASFALNITGSSGLNGTGAVVQGPTGPTGDRGVTGFRGKSVFLLSSSWSGSACGGAPPDCYPVEFASVSEVGGLYNCNFGELTTYYTTTALPLIDNTSLMFYNPTCTSPMNDVSPIGANGSTVRYTTGGTNVIQQLAFCNTSE